MKAGSIPYYIDADKIYVCLFTPNNPKFGGTSLQLPKGGLDEKETIKEAAIRETIEEVGIPAKNMISVEFLSKEKTTGYRRNYFLSIYIIEVDNLVEMTPQKEGHGTWVELTEALESIRPSQKIFLEKFVDIIKKK